MHCRIYFSHPAKSGTHGGHREEIFDYFLKLCDLCDLCDLCEI